MSRTDLWPDDGPLTPPLRVLFRCLCLRKTNLLDADALGLVTRWEGTAENWPCSDAKFRTSAIATDAQAWSRGPGVRLCGAEASGYFAKALGVWIGRTDGEGFYANLLSGFVAGRRFTVAHGMGYELSDSAIIREAQAMGPVFINFMRDILAHEVAPDVRLKKEWLRGDAASPALLAADAANDDAISDVLPYLADALEDNGCADERVIDHCRRPPAGGHSVTCCWLRRALRKVLLP